MEYKFSLLKNLNTCPVKLTNSQIKHKNIFEMCYNKLSYSIKNTYNTQKDGGNINFDIYESTNLFNWYYHEDLYNIWVIPEITILGGLLSLIIYSTYLLILNGEVKHSDVMYITNRVEKLYYTLTFLTISLCIYFFICEKIVCYKTFLVFNFFSMFAKLTITLLTLFVIYSLKPWYLRCRKNVVELYILILGGTFFAYLVSSSTNLFFSYITLEGISTQSYTLAIYSFSDSAVDIVLKYFLLGGLASGILLYGISLLFGTLGSLNYTSMVQSILSNIDTLNNIENISKLTKVAMLLTIFGLLFKLGAYPMHLWVPGVYSKSPNPITIYFATTIKIVITFLMIKVVFTVFDNCLTFLKMFLLISAIGSMLAGAVGAMKELKIKNFVAYTSVNQAGFTMLGLCCQTDLGVYYTVYYIIIYITLTTGFLTLMFNIYQNRTASSLIFFSDLKHINKGSFLTAIILTTYVLSFAGFPPFAGFFGKLNIYYALAKSNMLIVLLNVLLINIASLYYYVRILKSMWFENLITEERKVLGFRITDAFTVQIVIIVSSLFNIFFLSFATSYDTLVIRLFTSLQLLN